MCVISMVKNNPRKYQFNEVNVGDQIAHSKINHIGFIKKIFVNGFYEVWGTVISISNEHHCLIECQEIRFQDKIVSLKKKNQYFSSLNFWKGDRGDEEDEIFYEPVEEEPTYEELNDIEKLFKDQLNGYL